jgi:hypothetical protein
MMATLMPAPASLAAIGGPAWPAPTMIASKSSDVVTLQPTQMSANNYRAPSYYGFDNPPGVDRDDRSNGFIDQNIEAFRTQFQADIDLRGILAISFPSSFATAM